MSDQTLEERTLQVLGLPSVVDEELLFLYFENKRRSGGGPLVSVERTNGDGAILVFEEAEVAAQVLSKGHHVLHNVELSVRKLPPKDPCRLLLRGLKPSTITEMIELYVENMMGLNVTDYTLHPSPQRDLILIQLSHPLSKDFQSLCAKISKRTLDGAKVTLERIEQTDSILAENLHPGTTPELLTVYFEGRGGGGQVQEVTMLSESTAKVAFADYNSVGSVLDLQHKLEGADLVVQPYFDFLQPAQSLKPQDSEVVSQELSEIPSEDVSGLQTPAPMVVSEDSQPSSQAAAEPLLNQQAVEETAEALMEDQPEEEIPSSHIAITDKIKLALFERGTFQQDTKKAHPNVTIDIKNDGVHITSTDRQTCERVKHSILEYFGEMAESQFILDQDKAEFLARKDVKEHLLQTLNRTGSPALFTVSDCNVVVASLSLNLANQVCSFLKSQLSQFSMQVDAQHEGMFYCREWSEFLQTLGFSSVKVSERGGNIAVLTLKGMEGEKQTAILEFLRTPIERETVISMEPGVLKYIQIHRHQLLADMDQVSIFPLEAEDACGLKIHGQAVACQMAEEVLNDVVSSICTRAITINAPGVTRFFEDKECKSILKEMEKKFQVYIHPQLLPWEYLPHQDIFQTAWTLMSHQNFQKVSLDGSSDAVQSAKGQGLLEEAKKIVSSIDGKVEDGMSNLEQFEDMDDLDLYTGDGSLPDQGQKLIADPSQQAQLVNTTSGLRELKDGVLSLPSNLEEEAQLSLAIQYSMESSHWSVEDEEEQLQKALELSKQMIQPEASPGSTDGSHKTCRQKKSPAVCIQEAIASANTLQLFVFAGYSSDLIRVDIAFGKKVTQRQVEEKLEHRTVKNMSEYHRKCLEMIKRKHGVDIQIQGTIITVSGFKDFVTGAVCDVKLLLEKLSNFVTDKEILKSVQWGFHNLESSGATLYSPDVIVFIENMWRMKMTRFDILLDNQPHTLDLEKMLEHNIPLGKSVKISRKLLNLEDLAEDVPEEEYTLLSNMPEASKIDEESDEFQNVVKSFYETIQEYHSKIRIIQVEKLMNRLLYNQYKLKKASVLQRATFPVIERTLYHGTSESSVKEICIHGFNRSFCGKNATVYGQGVYFAVNSALSVQDQYSPPNTDGYKFVFVSKVLTGDYTKGCHSMKTAPLKETGDIPLRYDSVTDDITKPSMFVIFNDTQAFPEYLITCQRIHR